MLFQRDKRNFGGKISKSFRQPVPWARQSQSGRTQAEELDKGCLCVPGSGEASKALPRPVQRSRSTEPEQPSVELLSAPFPHAHASRHPEVFPGTVSTLTEIQCVGCAHDGQVGLTGTTCSSTSFSSNREWLNARSWHESFRSCGDESFRSCGAPQRHHNVGYVVFSPSSSLTQQFKNLLLPFCHCFTKKCYPVQQEKGGDSISFPNLLSFFGNLFLK